MDTNQDPNPDLEAPVIDYAPGAEPTPEPKESIPDAQQSDEEQHLLKIDRRNLHSEIARLQREDPDFANAYNTDLGRKAKAKWQSRVDELDTELQATKRKLREREILAMSEDDINEKFKVDPAFAKEYAEVVHRDPRADDYAQTEIQKRNALDDIFSTALDYGLPEEKVTEVIKAIQSGKYDVDEEGKPVTHWVQGLNRVQRDVTAMLLSTNKPTPKPADPEPDPSTKVNPELSRPGPDTSQASVRNTRRDSSIEQYKKDLAEGKQWSSDEVDRVTAKYATMG